MKNTLQIDGAMKLVLCDCGKLHVTVGSVTLHFTRDEFQVFAESIRRLAAIVAQPSENQTLMAPQLTSTQVCH